MALGGLATVTTILFLLVQLLQGILLDVYLELYVCPVHADVSQWSWVAVDGFLLLAWLFFLLVPTKNGRSPVRRKLWGVPALSVGWAVYLLFVLLPRTVWVIDEAGRCLGKSGALRSSSIQSAISSGVGNFSLLSQSTWGSNAWVTITSAGTTSLVVLLTITGHADHGLVKQKSALDFDLAEAAFAVIDGVEYWHAFFGAVEYKCKVQCSGSRSNSASTTTSSTLKNDTSLDSTTILAITTSTSCVPSTASSSSASQQQPTVEQLDYIRALDGNLGIFIMMVASASFALPFFPLWEMQLKSERNLMKAAGLIDSTDGVRRKKVKARVNAVYIFYDLFLVNAPGFGVRIYLWLQYKQAISALITKNVLGIIFRFLQIWVKFIQPCFHKSKKAVVRRATRKKIDVVLPAQPNRAAMTLMSASRQQLFQADRQLQRSPTPRNSRSVSAADSTSSHNTPESSSRNSAKPIIQSISTDEDAVVNLHSVSDLAEQSNPV